VASQLRIALLKILL